MKTSWTQGLDKERAIEIRKDFVGGALLRARLQKLLEDKINNVRVKSRAGSTYDNPNWALVQADTIGYEKALSEVISLIS